MNENIWNNESIIETIKKGGVIVMPTDTIYGIVCSAMDGTAVARIYNIRNRDLDKPCIILISDITELERFSIDLSDGQKSKISEYWQLNEVKDFRPTSIVFDCANEALTYLHRGTNTLAFRLPQSKGLRELIQKTGPLIAPSANTAKFPASENIEQARAYFGDTVDLYVDGGPVISEASKVIRLQKDGGVSILRA